MKANLKLPARKGWFDPCGEWIGSGYDAEWNSALDEVSRLNQEQPSPAPELVEITQEHGHVVPRADGVKARCGGPAVCKVCQAEQDKTSTLMLLSMTREERDAAQSRLAELEAELADACANAEKEELRANEYSHRLAELEGQEPVAMRCQACNSPRKGAACHKCGGQLTEKHPSWDEPALPDVDRIRELAREVGYAIGVHGSLERDLDLIAAPWQDGAVSAEQLCQRIADGLGGTIVGVAEEKPLGRYAVNIQIPGWFKLIDLSVAPAAQAGQAGQVPEGVRAWFEAKQAHVNAVDAYNARLKFVRAHCTFGTSVDPEYQLMEEADRKARALVVPMFDELRGLLAAAPAQGGE